MSIADNRLGNVRLPYGVEREMLYTFFSLLHAPIQMCPGFRTVAPTTT